MMITNDISTGAESTLQGKSSRMMVETITRLLRRKAMPVIQKILAKTHPADIASLLDSLPEEYVFAIFTEIADKHVAATVLGQVDRSTLEVILKEESLDELAVLLRELPPDELTDFISHLSPEVAEKVMAVMSEEEQDEVENLLQYAPDSAGGIMTTDFFALEKTATAGQAIEQLRSKSDVEMVFYLYVTDEDGRLVGVISLRDLLLVAPDTPLSKIMNQRVIKVRTDTKEEDVAELTDKYRLLAIPVVDDRNVLVGIVTVDDVIEIIEDKTTNEMLKMAGTDEAEIQTHSAIKTAWIRLPWLLAAFGGGLGATMVIQNYESILAKVLALSAFLPVIMGMAGNVGVQAATVAVRGLATGDLNVRDVWSVLFKEARVGLILGLFYGVALGIYGFYVFSSPDLGQAVGLTILINMVGASLLAIGLPIFFHRVGVDPAVATGPFVTTTIDVLGVLNYFAIASVIFDFPVL